MQIVMTFISPHLNFILNDSVRCFRKIAEKSCVLNSVLTLGFFVCIQGGFFTKFWARYDHGDQWRCGVWKTKTGSRAGHVDVYEANPTLPGPLCPREKSIENYLFLLYPSSIPIISSKMKKKFHFFSSC